MFNPVKPMKISFFMILIVLFSFLSKVSFAYPNDTFLNFANQTRADHKRNHQLCYAYEDHTPGLPCNPAFLGLDRQSTGWIYGYGNNNLQFFQDVADIVRGPIKAQELLAIVDHNSHDNFQLELSMGYVANTWGFNLIPDKLVLFTNFRNPALPRITVLAAREREVQFQLGSFLNKEWSWGLQFRGVQRRFTYSDAYFSDYMTGDADFLNSVKAQNAFYIEPSLLYAPENSDLNPLISFMINNLGKPDFYIDPYDFNPVARVGLSIAPKLDYGSIKLGVTSQWLRQAEFNRIFTAAGLSYSYSWFEIFSTLSEFEKQAGVAFNFDYLTTGFSYAEQDWSYNPSPNAHALWRWDLGILF